MTEMGTVVIDSDIARGDVSTGKMTVERDNDGDGGGSKKIDSDIARGYVSTDDSEMGTITVGTVVIGNDITRNRC